MNEQTALWKKSESVVVIQIKKQLSSSLSVALSINMLYEVDLTE